MTRTAHFSIGIGLCLFCCVWCVVGQVLYMAAVTGGASVTDASFIATFIFWAIVFLGGAWIALRSFWRALRPPRRIELPVVTPTSDQQPSLTTPNDKLAHLVKKD
jgi:hypothetical protein